MISAFRRYMRTRHRVLAAVIVSWSLVTCGLGVEKRRITETDIFQFRWAANPQLSPDGSQAAYVLVTVNQKEDSYETSLWLVPADGKGEPRRLTTGPRDTSPRWSPDGKRLAFLRAPMKDGKPQPAQIYLLDLGGGEPMPLTDLPKGASQTVWSPDGMRLAFQSSTTPDDLKKKEAKPERESDVRVISRAVYRFNGQGYLDPRRPDHIWVTDVPARTGDATPTPRQVTSGAYDEDDITWSTDGTMIYFTSMRVPEPYYFPSLERLYAVPAAGGAPVEVASMDGGIGSLALSPDGKWMAFRAQVNTPLRSYTQTDLWVVSTKPGSTPRNLTPEFDWDIGGGIIADQKPPRAGGGTRPMWSADGASLIDVVAKQGRADLYRFEVASGKATALTNGNHEIFATNASDDRSTLAFLVSTPLEIGDVFVMPASGGALRRLTHVNQELLTQLDLTMPEEIWYTGFDGRKIPAFVQKPPGFDPAKKYPLILNIHGGPHTAYGYSFFHEVQWMAAKGYVVLYPNPRGSTSYGQDFGNIIQYAYPGDDAKDLLLGVDELIKRGYVDEKRLGVTGGSGGGVLTNWLIGKTDRFAAAVSQRSIADWADWWYTADFSQFQPYWFKGPPWEDKDFVTRSPISLIANVKTPLMLIEGEADYRTPPTAGGEQMFRALKYKKIPTVMIRFPGESHDLSRSGKPWHRVERLQHILNWFDVYLMGKKAPEYDPNPENWSGQ
jgi:dipeptidyl aminopeptidase/acylaminoacyl peptidase